MAQQAATLGTEVWRISVEKQLEEWLASDRTQLAFPADLSKEERRYLHETCPRLGLTTKSTGTGEKRFLTVSKPSKEASAGVSATISLPTHLQRAVRDHLARFPPDDDEKIHVANRDDETGTTAQKKQPKKKQKGQPPPAEKPPKPDVLKKRQAALTQRSKLPAWAFRDRVAALVNEHPVLLISGATGCGKSTQVPQFILDASSTKNIRIACSQPRRLSAIAVAERVAQERGEKVGDSVGYEVRFERAVKPENARLVFATPGVLLRKLAANELNDYTHVIIDEVHEEDKDTEFLVVACRELARRGSHKLILMSATLAVQKLVDYFSQSTTVCPTLSVGSRTFPVECFYLEDVLRLTGFVAPVNKKTTTINALSLTEDEQTALAAMAKTKAQLTCAMCGKTGFRTPQELGDHCADCDGTSLDLPDLLDDDADGVHDDLSVFIDVAAGPTNRFFDDDTGKAAKPPPKPPTKQQQPPKNKNSTDDDDDDDDDEEDDDDDFEEEEDDGNLGGGGATTAAPPAYRMDDDHPRATESEVRAYQRSVDDESVDAKLVCGLLRYVTTSAYDMGAVLVFVPGWAEIVEVVNAIEEDPQLKDRCVALALHSSLETGLQKLAFAPPPPGKWKIVVATNVAETSITIPDVSFVIDTGLEKTLAHDVILGASVLRTHRIAQASADQRLGRAGRTRPGLCFRLWTRRRHRALEPRRKSELLRANLDGLCLQAATLDLPWTDVNQKKQQKLGARDFLRRAVNPPADKAVDRAVKDLVAMGALQKSDERPTSLGEALSRLPLPPRLALAALYCRLLNGTREDLAVPCVLEAKDPFAKGTGTGAAKHRFASGWGQPHSDVAALVGAYSGFHKCHLQKKLTASSYCRTNNLNFAALSLVDAAVRQIDAVLPGQTGPQKSLSRAIAVAALYPNVASRSANEMHYTGKSGARCRLHGSALANKRSSPYSTHTKAPTTQILAFGALLEYVDSNNRAGLAVATVAPADPLAILLLCHAHVSKQNILDGWLQLDSSYLDSLLLIRFRLRKALSLLLNGVKVTPQSYASLADALHTASLLLLHDGDNDEAGGNNSGDSHHDQRFHRSRFGPSSGQGGTPSAGASSASSSRGLRASPVKHHHSQRSGNTASSGTRSHYQQQQQTR